MESGLLWFDDDPARTLEEKAERAAQRYRQKHGQQPNVCYVHPSSVDGERRVGQLTIAPLPTVLRHHFWLGVER